MHPHFNRIFLGLMSLVRRSHGPADVIAVRNAPFLKVFTVYVL